MRLFLVLITQYLSSFLKPHVIWERLFKLSFQQFFLMPSEFSVVGKIQFADFNGHPAVEERNLWAGCHRLLVSTFFDLVL